MEEDLQCIARQGKENNPGVLPAVPQQVSVCPKESQDIFQPEGARQGENSPCAQGDDRKEGKETVRLVPLSLAEALSDEGRAAGPENQARRGGNQQQGNHKVDGGESRFAGVIGNEKAIDDAVDRFDDHHGDGRDGELPQTAIGEVLSEGVRHKP